MRLLLRSRARASSGARGARKAIVAALTEPMPRPRLETRAARRSARRAARGRVDQLICCPSNRARLSGESWGVGSGYFVSPSRHARISRSELTASRIGITGRTSKANAASTEQNFSRSHAEDAPVGGAGGSETTAGPRVDRYSGCLDAIVGRCRARSSIDTRFDSCAECAASRDSLRSRDPRTCRAPVVSRSAVRAVGDEPGTLGPIRRVTTARRPAGRRRMRW